MSSPFISSADSPARVERALPAAPGLFGRAVLRLLTHSARVDAVHVLSPDFRLVTLRCDAFRTQAHVPGDKLQVRVDGMAMRTFTPVRAAADDSLELIAHLQGDAPASRWLAALAPGDTCDVLGPRRSMDLGAIERSTVFFGDETSLGLALALCTTPLGGLDTHFIFELGDPAQARGVLDALGRGMLRNAMLVARRAGDAHLADVEAALTRYAVADSFRQYVFSGKSTSIQRLTRSLKLAGAKPSQMLVKAYWAPGRTALD